MSGRGGKKRQKAVSKSARAGVLFPVSRMNRYLRRLSYRLRISAAAPVYQAAVIEYLTGMFTRKIHIADDNNTEGKSVNCNCCQKSAVVRVTQRSFLTVRCQEL